MPGEADHGLNIPYNADTRGKRQSSAEVVFKPTQREGCHSRDSLYPMANHRPNASGLSTNTEAAILLLLVLVLVLEIDIDIDIEIDIDDDWRLAAELWFDAGSAAAWNNCAIPRTACSSSRRYSRANR
jgi:hypothetical protein